MAVLLGEKAAQQLRALYREVFGGSGGGYAAPSAAVHPLGVLRVVLTEDLSDGGTASANITTKGEGGWTANGRTVTVHEELGLSEDVPSGTPLFVLPWPGIGYVPFSGKCGE